MTTRSILILVILAASAFVGPGGVSSAAEPPLRAVCVDQTGAPQRATAPLALGAEERTELERASAASTRLEALRGGEVSDHDLNVALLVVGIVLILILI